MLRAMVLAWFTPFLSIAACLYKTCQLLTMLQALLPSPNTTLKLLKRCAFLQCWHPPPLQVLLCQCCKNRVSLRRIVLVDKRGDPHQIILSCDVEDNTQHPGCPLVAAAITPPGLAFNANASCMLGMEDCCGHRLVSWSLAGTQAITQLHLGAVCSMEKHGSV